MRIAQAMIWWEEAWEAVLPEERRRNPFTRSIFVDNVNFQGMTREAAIRALEDSGNRRVYLLVRLVNPDGSRHWGINFSNLITDQAIQTIEFRKFGVARSREDVYTYIACAAAFIHAAIQLDDDSARALFTSVPARTVAGLENFMLGAVGPFDREAIRRLFSGIRWRPTIPVLPCTEQSKFDEPITPESHHQVDG